MHIFRLHTLNCCYEGNDPEVYYTDYLDTIYLNILYLRSDYIQSIEPFELYYDLETVGDFEWESSFLDHLPLPDSELVNGKIGSLIRLTEEGKRAIDMARYFYTILAHNENGELLEEYTDRTLRRYCIMVLESPDEIYKMQYAAASESEELIKN